MAAKTKGNMRKMAKTAKSSWPREHRRGGGAVKLIEIELLTNSDSSPCKHTHIIHSDPHWTPLIRARGSGMLPSCHASLIATPVGVRLDVKGVAAASAALILFWISPAKYYFQFIIILAHLFGIKRCELAIICYQLIGVCVCAGMSVFVWGCTALIAIKIKAH